MQDFALKLIYRLLKIQIVFNYVIET